MERGLLDTVCQRGVLSPWPKFHFTVNKRPPYSKEKNRQCHIQYLSLSKSCALTTTGVER